MVKHFSSKSAAETDLAAHGFARMTAGRWVKVGFRATIHPSYGNTTVAVVYEEVRI